MSTYTRTNLDDVKDSAPQFGFGEVQEAHFASGDLETQQTGVSFHRVKPGKRQGFAHRHDEAEEVYVVIGGSGRVKLDDDIVDLERLDAVRLAPGVTRQFEGGPVGIEILVFGARHEGDGETIDDWWTDSYDDRSSMIVHLIDGTYELFRQFYGRKRFKKDGDHPMGAAAGVCGSLLQMIEGGATHIGVATDHVIESFRNDLWPGYKTGAGVDPALRSQFEPLEEALGAMGVVVWPMVKLEADDALASAARIAAADSEVEQVCIWSPDKDLGQCVERDRVVQVDRRADAIRDAAAIREKFGVDPALIPDLLALVGDSADGYPGIKGIGKVGAARMLNQYGPIESFPPEALADERRELALLFKDLATLRSGEQLFAAADDLRWEGPAEAFADVAEHLGDERLLERSLAAPR